MKKRIVILFSGRGSNMQVILKNCHKGILQDRAEAEAVFSNNPLAGGIEIARQMGVPVQVISSRNKKRQDYNNHLKNWLLEMNPDYIVLAGYMLLLPVDIVKLFPQRIINIHPADTNQHQGLHGYEWAWNKKLPETRITVHYVDEGLDTGSIIAQEKVDMSDCHSLEEVEERGLQVEHSLYSRILAEIIPKEN
jgi:phosphoribosylglycinamide formyltransferase-1